MRKVVGFACLSLFLMAFRCPKESTGFSVFNETGKSMLAFIPDEFEQTRGRIGFYAHENDGSLLLPNEMKELFVVDDKYHHSFQEWKGSRGVIFYFINEEYFEKTFEEIKAAKLYDSLWVSQNDYHLNEADNYIFKYKDKAVFTNTWKGPAKKEAVEVFGIEIER